MKRIIAVLLLIALSFSMLACAAPAPAEEQSSQEQNNEEEDNVAYFEHIVQDELDSFGVKTGERHYVEAECYTVNVQEDSKISGKVYIQYDYNDSFHKKGTIIIGPFMFDLMVKTSNGDFAGPLTNNVMEFKINETEYRFPSRYDDGTLSGDIDESVYTSAIYNALMDGDDVICSVWRGEYLFTVSGKGFKEIVESLPNQ